MHRKQVYAFLYVFALVVGLLFLDYDILTSSTVVSPRIARRLQERLGGVVRVGEVDIQEVGTIRCRKILIQPPAEVSLQDNIECDQLHIDYRGSLLAGSWEPTRVLVHGLKADVSRASMRYWIKRLTPEVADVSGAAAALPILRIEADRITTDLPELFAADPRVALRDVRFTIHPLDQRKVWGEFAADAAPYGKWSGRLLYDVGQETARVDLGCPAFDLREPLAQRMVPPVRRAWENYAVEGPTGIEGRLDFDLARSRGPRLKDWRFQLRCARENHVSGRYHGFPYRVQDLDGDCELLPGGVRIRGLQGRTAEGTLFLHGRSSGYEAEAAVELDLRLDRFRLDDEARDTAPAGLRSLWGDLGLSGTVDIEGRVTRPQGPERPTRIDLVLHATDVAARPQAFPYALRQVRGEVLYRDGALELRHLEGVHGETRLHVEGQVGSVGDASAGYALDIQADRVPLDAELRQALPPEVQKVWDLLAPAGRVDVVWSQRRTRGQEETRHRVRIASRGAEVEYREPRIPLKDIWGELEYDGAVLELRGLKGVCQGAPVTLQGNIRWTGAGTTAQVEIGAERLALEGPFLEILPERLHQSAVEAGLAGRLDARVRLVRRAEPGQETRGSYAAELHLQDGAVKNLLELDDIVGSLHLAGEFRPGGHTLAGVLKLSQARVAGKRVTDVGGVCRLTGDRLVFHDLRGTAYDGIVHLPFLEVDPTRGRYEGEGRVEGVDLALFARDTFIAGRPIAGRVSGRLAFGGEPGKPESIRARGKAVIKDGNLWEVPVFLQLVRVLNLGPPPAQESFHSGRVQFSIAGGLARIESFLFESPSVRLTGDGEIKFDGKLRLAIDTEFTSTLLSGIPGLRELIDLLKRNVVGVEVRGTFRKPRVRLKAFPFKDFRGGEEEAEKTEPGELKR